MSRCLFYCGLLVCLLLTGCDAVTDIVNPEQKRQKEEAQQEVRDAIRAQKAKAEEVERAAGERVALQKHIEASLDIIKLRLDELMPRKREVSADRLLLAERIRQLTARDADGKLKPRHVIVADLMEDAQINVLAGKYLDHDFQLLRFRFIEQVTNALEVENRRKAALKGNQAAYQAAIEETKQNQKNDRETIETARKQLRDEMERLEKRKRELQRGMLIVPAKERVQRERELNDVLSNLKSLNAQYDGIRVGRMVYEGGNRSGDRSQRQIDQAFRQRQKADEIVMRQFENLKTVSSIVTAYEGQTIGALEEVIGSAEDATDAEWRKMEETSRYLKSMSTGLNGLDLPALNRLRATIDERLYPKQAGK